MCIPTNWSGSLEETWKPTLHCNYKANCECPATIQTVTLPGSTEDTLPRSPVPQPDSKRFKSPHTAQVSPAVRFAANAQQFRGGSRRAPGQWIPGSFLFVRWRPCSCKAGANGAKTRLAHLRRSWSRSSRRSPANSCSTQCRDQSLSATGTKPPRRFNTSRHQKT